MAQTVRAANANPASVLVPHESWSCGLPAGIPSPETGALVSEANMKLERLVNVGRTPYGQRRVAVVQEDVVSGARLTGSVMTGALDFELTLVNGVVEVAWLNAGTYVARRVLDEASRTMTLRVRGVRAGPRRP